MTTGSDRTQAAPPLRPVTLALEDGGSLGAFTWGVLDRLLDVPGLCIDVVSGTSAGAMNAAMLVQGLATGGPSAAKRLLETFWHRVAIASGSLPGPVGAWMHLIGGAMAPMVDVMRHAGTAFNTGVGRGSSNPLRGILGSSAVLMQLNGTYGNRTPYTVVISGGLIPAALTNDRFLKLEWMRCVQRPSPPGPVNSQGAWYDSPPCPVVSCR